MYRFLWAGSLVACAVCPAPILAQATTADLRARSQAVLAQLDGQISLAGPRQSVEIVRDRWGIAHIYAHNADDLFFAQGWLAAQDRLFQVDLWRRVGNGETAAILGPDAVEADRFARLIRYRGDMDAEWKSYGSDTQAIATAFTRGINAYIEHLGDKLPIEFQIMGYRPKRWRPEDILGRMSGIIMSRNFSQEIARARLVATVGAEKSQQLAPTDPPIAFAAAPELDLNEITKDILSGFQAASKAIRFGEKAIGTSAAHDSIAAGFSASNNWVIASPRSASGKPMLASDPHRSITVPSLRYMVHLHAPGWNVIGAGEPALPGVALGHNDNIAWGITIVGTDQADIYVEKTDPADPTRYRVNDRWETMNVVREQVEVKGQTKPIEVELRFTRHGPVIHQDANQQRAYSLKWTGNGPGGAAYLGGLAVSRARNRQEFLKSLDHWRIPSLNFVYADTNGEVGWVAAGAMPIRNKTHHGLLPVPGWTSAYEWEGHLSVSEMPQAFNPPQQWLASANHNILPKGFSRPVAYEWAPPHRFLRIQQRLEGKQRFSLDDFQSIQHENTTLPGKALARLLAAIPERDPKTAEFVKLMAPWDGVLARDSAAGALYAIWLQEIERSFYDRIGLDKETARAFKLLNNITRVLAELENPSSVWFNERPKTNRDDFLISTFAKAVARAQRLLGDDPTRWRWGTLHTATFHHPLEQLGPSYAKAFNLGPVERSGDVHTPHNTRHDENFKQVHGASYRHVFDLADWDKGRATSTPGQSGQPGSPHYEDLLPLWAAEQYFPLAFSRRKVDEVAAHRLVLAPR